ncbi:M23 family metallopeptidase [candidate division KSB1 bacterium]|nr:M23 family metallopeptidase [candidate division KSB1 bacterium]
MDFWEQYLNRRIKIAIWLCVLVSLAGNAISQTYLWPTNASTLISSSFAEWRSGHFHAGIDIKTFGRNGYPVYAISSGYIWRVRVSPYGYGKVLYQKLDTGDIAVYAHLDGFIDSIEMIVKKEQRRKGQYSVNKYFEANELPVERGQIIAFTGESGIGPSHLHFELRDSRNRPFNPFLNGYELIDNRKPVISAISVSPLSAGACVNGEFVPAIKKPIFIGNGRYKIQQPIQLSGIIGFGAKTYDQTGTTHNKLGIHKTKFYLDDLLLFSAVYDRFSYAETGQIFLDRDYRLLKRDSGIFYKLYIDESNELDFYSPRKPGSGLISDSVLRALAANQSRSLYESELRTNGSTNTEQVSRVKGADEIDIAAEHHFKIEISDYNNHTSEVTGTIIRAHKCQFRPKISVDESGTAYLQDLGNVTGDQINKLDVYVSYNSGAGWNRILRWQRTRSNAASAQNALMMRRLVKAPSSKYGTLLLKAVIEDTNGIESYPFFQVIKGSDVLPQKKGWIKLDKDFYNQYVIFNLDASLPLETPPKLIVQLDGHSPAEISPLQTDLLEYIGIYEFPPDYSGRIDLRIEAYDIASRGIFYEESFYITPAPASMHSEIQSNDGQLTISIPSNALYKPLFFRIDEEPFPAADDTNQIGNIYRIHPFDEPLKKSIRISLHYPAEYSFPEKLGIYSRNSTSSRWNFENNQWDPKSRTISAKIASLKEVTLFRDTQPPEIRILIPYNGSRLRNEKFQIKAFIRDRESGFNTDKHVQLMLDDKKIIAEFDPEKHQLLYRSDESLASGQHQIQLIVADRAGNQSSERRNFWLY